MKKYLLVFLFNLGLAVSAMAQVSLEMQKDRQVDEALKFGKRSKDLSKFVEANVNYPFLAEWECKNGVVDIRLDIDEFGVITELHVLTNEGFGMEQAASDVMKLTSGNWIPAQRDGQNVPSHVTISMHFMAECNQEIGRRKSYFSGRNYSMYQFTKDQLKYPSEAEKNGVQGTVKLKFWIGQSGEVLYPEILSDTLGSGIEEEALRFLKRSSGYWKPAKYKGKFVPSQQILYLDFFKPVDYSDDDDEDDGSLLQYFGGEDDSWYAFVQEHWFVPKGSIIAGTLRYKFKLDSTGTPFDIRLSSDSFSQEAMDAAVKVIHKSAGLWDMSEIKAYQDTVEVHFSQAFEVGQLAEFIEGERGLQRYIAQQYNFPNHALNAEAGGLVIVQFVVDSSGNVNRFEVITPLINYGVEDEAIRVLRSTSGMWKPAQFKGEAVAMRFKIPINLTLY